MIQRLGELRPAIGEAFVSRGHAVEDRGGTVVVGELCVVDWRETTGPITEKSLRAWIGDLPGDRVLVLISMGHFAAKALSAYLAEPETRKRVVLVEMGLRNYFEEGLQPAVVAHDANRQVVEAIAEALARHDLDLTRRHCAHCEAATVVLCGECGAMLCKSHMLICPLCGQRTCHTDVPGRECFHKHRCG